MNRSASREKNPGPDRDRSPVGTALSTNSRSSQMTGVPAEPSPGSGTFQRTLASSLHPTGGSPAGAAPVRSGPRHSGQNPAASPAGCAAAGAIAAADRYAAAIQNRTTQPLPLPFARSIRLHLGSTSATPIPAR